MNELIIVTNAKSAQDDIQPHLKAGYKVKMCVAESLASATNFALERRGSTNEHNLVRGKFIFILYKEI